MVTYQPLRFLRLRYLFWLAIPLLLWWALPIISWGEVWAALSRLGLLQILVLMVANAMVLLLFSGRWWLILRAQGYTIPYLTLAGHRLAAFGVSYFTPGPQFGGEPLQVYLVQRHHRVPCSTAISAVTLDKSLELGANFAFLGIGAGIILHGQVFSGPVGQQAILFALGLLTLPVGFLLAVWGGKHPISGLFKIGSQLLPQRWVRPNAPAPSIYREIYRTVKDSEDQTAHFCREHSVTMMQALLVSIVSWGSIIGEYWLALHLLGLSLTPVQAISALTAARIAILLPMPGGLGTLEASQVLALSALGLNPAVGISLSLLIRLRDVALGGLGLWWGGSTLRSGERCCKVY
jgi:uncharacterized protein (TIRG00374 family)